ncbi:hypothetical protein jhhlp_005141 [Lomentospora prolificans]|uniref:Uncharacterized protein n=1 Tax=Lomentospora prolificans TaxID=41688 RepID=A0A2N3N7L6_9PEZI|nr:hypothetical protein jhhlp_005141 [Lomentospora prolificans]
MNSSYSLGSIFAVPSAPRFAHKFGRQWSVMRGLFNYTDRRASTGLSSARYITSISNSDSRIIRILFCKITSGGTLIGELRHPKERPVLITSPFNSSPFIGSDNGSMHCLRNE